jgi:hypothetical protein
MSSITAKRWYIPKHLEPIIIGLIQYPTMGKKAGLFDDAMHDRQ